MRPPAVPRRLMTAFAALLIVAGLTALFVWTFALERALDQAQNSANAQLSLAAGGLGAGYAVALPSYDLCPTVKISDITVQIARAINQVAGMVQGPISNSRRSSWPLRS